MKLLATTVAICMALSISFISNSQCADYGNSVQLAENSNHSPNYLLGSAISVPVNGTLTTVSMIAITAGPSYQVAIYDDAGGNPGNLITSGSGVLTAGLNVVDVPDVPVVVGTYYMMAVFNTSASLGYSNSGTETVYYISFSQGSPLPDPFGTPTTYTGQSFNYFFEVCNACADIIDPTASNPLTQNVECIADVQTPDVLVVTDELDDSGIAPIVAFVGDVSDGQTCPETITRTYSVTDDCGNQITVDQLIIVNDVTNPTGTAPPDVAVECLGDVPVPDTAEVTTEADNCTISPVVTWIGDVSDSLSCPETITRTYGITDDCGNQIMVDQTITVQDVTAPVPVSNGLPDITNECSVAQPSIPTATDNCSDTLYGVSNVAFPVMTSGTTVVTWTFTDGCGNTYDQMQNIIVTDIDNSVIVNSAAITANATGYSYQWVDCDNGNAPIQFATNQIYIATVTGNYAVEISDGTCTVTSPCSLIDFTGLSSVDESTIEIYPNPAVDGEIHFSGIDAPVDVKVIDMLGRAIKVSMNLTEKTIDVSSLDKGKYILQIFTDSNSYSKEFVVIN